MNKVIKFIAVLLLFVIPTSDYAQGMFNQVANDNNYYVITQKLDSLFTLYPDTAEGGETKAYERWKWFWDKRVNDGGNQGNKGDFSQYIVNVENSINNPQYCKTSAKPEHAVNWQLLDPIEYEKQHMGRVDVVKTDPGNPNIVYAGTPASGLWRTYNKNADKPQWHNITDKIKLPAIGIYDFVINPANPNEAYISAGIAGWGRPYEYGIGVFKTTNLQNPQPDWFYTFLSYSNLGSNSFSFKKIILFPSNSSKLITFNKEEVYYSVDAGINWTSINVQNNFVPFFEIKDIEIDPSDNNIVYISGLLDKTYNKLLKYNINNNSFQEITNNLNFTVCDLLDKNNPIHLTRTNTAVYVLYKKGGTCNDNFSIEKTSNAGISFQTLSQPSGQSINTATPVFEVSILDDKIIYLEGGDGNGRVVLKSVDGGNFNKINYYNQDYNGTWTHADVRGMEFTNASVGGLNDEILIGNDGGILYSNSVNQNTNLVNWKDITGKGLAITQFYGLGVSQKRNDYFSGGTQDNGQFTYFNGGWKNSVTADGYDGIIERNSDKIYGQFWGGGSPAIQRSTNYGSTFSGYYQGSNSGNNVIAGFHYLEQPWYIDENDDFYFAYNNLRKTNTQIIGNQNAWNSLSDFTQDYGVPNGTLVKSFAVYPRDKNIIYLAFEHAIGKDIPAPLEKKLFKTENGLDPNPVWTDITANLSTTQSVRWCGISDVVVSPTNPNKVWSSFNDFWLSNGVVFNRVNYSSDGGNTWADITKNLPNLPVNKLIYLEGSNDGIFLANDIGVYYTDNILAAEQPNERWICVNTGLPYTIVTDFDINYCNRTLSISTFGRGIWQTDISNFLSATPYIVASNTNISGNFNLNSDMLIKAGNTLTLTGEMRVSREKKIMVEQGAKLIIDGGTITNYCHLWEGIEVWGDKTKNQFGAGNQGIVELKNGASIENARLGIRTWKTDANGNVLWNTTGGIVKADNATFRNCKHGVSIFPYHNTLPNGNPANNLSRFTNCTFITDDVLKIPNTYPGQMLTLYDVEGIFIKGCTFENAVPNLYPEGGRGKGIVSADASYRVIPFCNSMSFPCPQNALVPNTFKNLYKGIEASAIAGVAKIQVDKNEFTNNIVGIRIAGAGYADITNNTFEIPLSPNYIQFGGNTFGIYTEASYGHLIENNNFTSTGPEIANHTNYAIVSENTMFGGADIYRNTFTNTVVGVMAQQDNTKLTIDCNTHQTGNNSLFDWAVASGDLADQGKCISGLGYPAKNAFVKPCTDDQNIYHYTFDPSQLVYRYKDIVDEPVCRTIPEVDVDQCIPITPANLCLPKVSGPSAVALKPTVNALKLSVQEMQGSIDGGNTAALLALINSNAAPGQIKNTLLSASPYLSDEVIIALLQKNPALPHGHIKDIILANSPLTPAVMQVLSLINLPNGIKNEIQQAQTGISERRILEAEINATETQAQSIINSIVRYYLDSSYIDSAVAYLTEQGNTEARCAIVPICLQYGSDTAIACTHLAALSQTSDSLMQTTDTLRGKRLRNFCDLYTMLFRVKYSEGGYFALNTQDSLTLQGLIETKSPMGVHAQNLFALVYGKEEELWAEPLNTGINARKAAEEKIENTVVKSTYLKVYPNPTQTSIVVEVNADGYKNKTIYLSDIQGRVLFEKKLDEELHSIIISDEILQQGMYFISLFASDKRIETIKLVKTN